MSFESIALRENGQKILYSWFNALRTAGVAIESFLGSSFIAETEATIANGQGGATDVTGLLLDSAEVGSAIISTEIRRKTDSNESVSVGHLLARYLEATSTWAIEDVLSGDASGVTFSITAGGQVQYTSDTLAGTNYAGTMKFKAITFDI